MDEKFQYGLDFFMEKVNLNDWNCELQQISNLIVKFNFIETSKILMKDYHDAILKRWLSTDNEEILEFFVKNYQDSKKIYPIVMPMGFYQVCDYLDDNWYVTFEIREEENN